MWPSCTRPIYTEPEAAAAAAAALDISDKMHSAATAAAAAAPWCLRPTSLNDATLRDAFTTVRNLSATLEPQDRLIMYDAADEGEISVPLALGIRKRLDARRNTKPKKPDEQRLVCTPFNEAGFHFGKISNPGERLLTLPLQGSTYHVLTNKFPLFPKHMLLVADALVPQQMTQGHLLALTELLQATSFCAYVRTHTPPQNAAACSTLAHTHPRLTHMSLTPPPPLPVQFNSWCASASVNHFHTHIIDEHPPITKRPLVPGPVVAGVRCLTPVGFPGFCYVFEAAHAGGLVASLISCMQADNQPHNLLVTPRHIYVWPKPHVRPSRSNEIYSETVGGPELIGSLTVYNHEDLERLTAGGCEELFRINTAPLPSRALAAPSPQLIEVVGRYTADDATVHATATSERAVERKAISSSLTIDLLPQHGIHVQSWPQDRPIAKALANNIGLC